VREPGDLHRRGAAGDDAPVEQNPHRAGRRRDGNAVWRLESTDALNHLDASLFRHGGKTAGQLGNHLILACAHLFEVDLRLREGDAHIAQGLDLLEDGGRVQERLRGDAADVQTDPAEPVETLDQDDLLAEIRRSEGRRIAAGTGAEHDDLGHDLLHIAGGRRALGLVLLRRCRLRRGVGASVRHLEGQDAGALRNPIADRDLDGPDGAGTRRRDLHAGLVAFQGDQRRLFDHRVARRDQDLDDFHVFEIADVGDNDLDDVATLVVHVVYLLLARPRDDGDARWPNARRKRDTRRSHRPYSVHWVRDRGLPTSGPDPDQSRSCRRSPSSSPSRAVKRAPSAPSTTRWS
jgi:hypothetical protein